MAVEHSTITDPYVHEPKDIPTTSAGDGKVYVADGASSGAWEYLASQYGGVYSAHGDAVAIGTIGTTAKKLAAFSHDSPSNGITAAHATDSLTVTIAGDYYVLFSITFSTNAVGDAGVYQFHIRINDVETVIGMHRSMSGSSDTGSGATHGILTLATSDVITTWVESDDGGDGDDIDIDSIAMTVFLVKRA